MDQFLEEIVIRRNRGLQEFLYYLASLAMVLFAIIAFWMLTNLLGAFSIVALLVVLVFGGAAVYLFLFKDRLRTEYEYTFTNGDLDFAQVFNNQKRKNLGTMRVKNVDTFGPVDSDNFRKLINMPGLQRRNWFLNRGAALYYFYYQKESRRTLIVLEPSAELVDLIRRNLAHGAYHA